MDDDDWAPLPLESLELQESGATRGMAAPHPRPPAAAPVGGPANETAPPVPAKPMRWPKDVESPPNPAAQRLLRQMQERLATPPQPDDPVARALARRMRRELATSKLEEREPMAATIVGAAAPPGATPAAAGTPVPAAPTAAPAAVAAPGAPAAVPEQDPREQQEWFQQLPVAEQERLRAHWYAERHRYDGRGVLWWRKVWRACWQGALVFLVLSLLQAPLLGFGVMLPLTLAGALAAAGAQACNGGRFGYAFAGGLAFFAVMGPQVVISPLGLSGVLISAFGMAALGFEREMKRSGGFRALD